MNWTDEQRAIFSHLQTSEENLTVEARAGSGKTTSNIEGVRRSPFIGTACIAAFNTRIAQEIRDRVSWPIVGKTFNALGFGYVRKKRPGIRVDRNRGATVARRAQEKLIGDHASLAELGEAMPENPYAYRSWEVTRLIRDLVSITKNVLPFADSVEEIMNVASAFTTLPNCRMIERGLTEEVVARIALEAMRLALVDDGTIDFDDQVWWPLVKDWTYPAFGMVVVDETQDLNPAQVALAKRLNKGRYVFCGDPHQTLYQFRGAREALMDELSEEFNCTSLPLTVSFRCAQKIIVEAQKIVPDIFAVADAPEGAVHRVWDEDLVNLARPGDFILSRTNADLGPVWRALVQKGVPACILGKGVSGALIGIVDRIARERGTNRLDVLERALWNWAEDELRLAEEDPSRTDYAELAESQVKLIVGFMPQAETVKSLKDTLKGAFADDREVDDTRVILSTVHKVKGLEADRVFCLSWTLKARDNVRYVAVTRARRELYWVDRAEG